MNCYVDCGAGIGRITQDLLIKLFQRVDLVEPNGDFLNKAKENLDPSKLPAEKRYSPSRTDYFCSALKTLQNRELL